MKKLKLAISLLSFLLVGTVALSQDDNQNQIVVIVDGLNINEFKMLTNFEGSSIIRKHSTTLYLYKFSTSENKISFIAYSKKYHFRPQKKYIRIIYPFLPKRNKRKPIKIIQSDELTREPEW